MNKDTWVLLITKYCDGPRIRALLQVNRYLWNLFNVRDRRALMMRREWDFGPTHEEEILKRLKEYEYYYKKETNGGIRKITICKCCYYTGIYRFYENNPCNICHLKIYHDPSTISWYSKWIKGWWKMQ